MRLPSMKPTAFVHRAVPSPALARSGRPTRSTGTGRFRVLPILLGLAASLLVLGVRAPVADACSVAPPMLEVSPTSDLAPGDMIKVQGFGFVDVIWDDTPPPITTDAPPDSCHGIDFVPQEVVLTWSGAGGTEVLAVVKGPDFALPVTVPAWAEKGPAWIDANGVGIGVQVGPVGQPCPLAGTDHRGVWPLDCPEPCWYLLDAEGIVAFPPCPEPCPPHILGGPGDPAVWPPECPDPCPLATGEIGVLGCPDPCWHPLDGVEDHAVPPCPDPCLAVPATADTHGLPPCPDPCWEIHPHDDVQVYPPCPDPCWDMAVGPDLYPPCPDPCPLPLAEGDPAVRGDGDASATHWPSCPDPCVWPADDARDAVWCPDPCVWPADGTEPAVACPEPCVWPADDGRDATLCPDPCVWPADGAEPAVVCPDPCPVPASDADAAVWCPDPCVLPSTDADPAVWCPEPCPVPASDADAAVWCPDPCVLPSTDADPAVWCPEPCPPHILDRADGIHPPECPLPCPLTGDAEAGIAGCPDPCQLDAAGQIVCIEPTPEPLPPVPQPVIDFDGCRFDTECDQALATLVDVLLTLLSRFRVW